MVKSSSAKPTEFKFYAPGVGLVLTLESDAREELLSVTP